MSFTAADVKTLREMTSVGMMDCKKALTECDGDMDKAVEYLREKGLAKAAKKAGRIAAEGMSYALVENGVGALVEVNCETDFCAKSDLFVAFVKDIAKAVLDNDPADVDALMNCKYPGTELTVVRDHAREGHVHRREPADPPLRPLRREHQRGLCPCRRQDRRSGEPGRGGRLDASEIGKNVAMQIAALNPRFWDKSQVTEDVLAEEKKIALALMDSDPKMASKPAAGQGEDRHGQDEQVL